MPVYKFFAIIFSSLGPNRFCSIKYSWFHFFIFSNSVTSQMKLFFISSMFRFWMVLQHKFFENFYWAYSAWKSDKRSSLKKVYIIFIRKSIAVGNKPGLYYITFCYPISTHVLYKVNTAMSEECFAEWCVGVIMLLSLSR